MATRKDLIKAHTFTASRLVAALVDRNPDRLDSPLRRVSLAFFASVMIGVLVVAGFGIAGYFTGGGRSVAWKASDTAVIIDSQAGQVFWYTQQQLYPMENIASAQLAAGPGAERFSLKTSSLRGVPRSTPLGIVGAPRTLPDAQDLSLYPVRVCAAQAVGDEPRAITMEFGRPVPNAQATPVALTDSAGKFFLVIEGIAHELYSEKGQTPALLVQTPFPRVDQAERLLNSLEPGSELSARQLLRNVKNRGEPSQNGEGAAKNIGTLVTVGDSAYYILLSDGFAPLAPLEYLALRAELGIKPVELAATQVQSRESEQVITAGDLPTVMPEIPSDPGLQRQSFCATFTDATSNPTITTGAPTPPVDPALRRTQSTRADLVLTEPGRGALVYNAAAMQAPESATLVTEGSAFAVPTAADLESLGYAAATRAPIRQALFRLIPPGLPDGVVLTSEQARRAVANP